jgi:integrase
MGLSAARSAARALHVEVKLHGADPIAERRRERARSPTGGGAEIATLSTLLDLYGEKVGGRKRTWEEARGRIEKVFKSFAGRPLADLNRNEIQIAADNYAAVMSASAAVRYLRPILKWGTQRGYVNEGLAQLHPPAPVKRRTRVLSDRELGLIVPVIRSSRRPAWRAMYFMLLTLARREEVAKARWQDIDWQSRTWTISETKNDQPHFVPLSSQAIAFLSQIDGVNLLASALIFSTTSGAALSNWDRETKALQRTTQTDGWHRHDLRRTSATALGNLGVLPDIVEASLNHAAIRSTLASTYNRARYRPQVRDALQRLADYLDAICEGGTQKILPFGTGGLEESLRGRRS